jgi:hypothetical protein
MRLRDPPQTLLDQAPSDVSPEDELRGRQARARLRVGRQLGP